MTSPTTRLPRTKLLGDKSDFPTVPMRSHSTRLAAKDALPLLPYRETHGRSKM
ncbi:cobyric acid synthase CobQ [Sesbania bispinosa]|nr:cobyric acid synthase CobQ [Sesbania bispinosa]